MWLLALFGLVALVPLSIRVARWGRGRVLHRAWFAWLPMAAPAVWLVACSVAVLIGQYQFGSLPSVPEDERSASLSDGMARALELSLVGALAALGVLAICFGYFSTRPRNEDD